MQQKKLSELTPDPTNPRRVSEEKLEFLRKSLIEHGDLSGIVFNNRTGQMVGGHQRSKVNPDAELVVEKMLPKASAAGTVGYGYTLIEGERHAVRFVDWPLKKQKAANIAANKGAGEWDYAGLRNYFNDLDELNFDLNFTMFNKEEIANIFSGEGSGPGGSGGSGEGDEDRSGNMQDKFLVPPFSILDARQGYWKRRKKRWMDLGIESELGRDDELLGNVSREGMDGNYDTSKGESAWGGSGTSIFDPVLCELVYRWFCPIGGTILDPFAGGSVRGVVASKLDRNYVGIDLRDEQIEANRDQAQVLCSDPMPVWAKGDSREIQKLARGIEADLMFTCPPYADLEVYSEKPEDISNMSYADFLVAYRDIIAQTCGMLKQDRFAAIVVGEVRDKKLGVYKNFIGHTIQAFIDAGLTYYNEALLATPIGTLPLRAGRAFSASRKLGKTHQNLLVFVKGDPKKATEACGAIEISDEMFAELVLDDGVSVATDT